MFRGGFRALGIKLHEGITEVNFAYSNADRVLLTSFFGIVTGVRFINFTNCPNLSNEALRIVTQGCHLSLESLNVSE